MKFNETLMFRILNHFGKWAVEENYYLIILGMPFAVLFFIIGMIVGIIIDICVAFGSVLKDR